MKIISKLQDYYDIGLSMGVDSTNVFVRSPEIVKDSEQICADVLKKLQLPFDNSASWYFDSYAVQRCVGVVGFCGKLYPFFFRYEIEKNIMKFYHEIGDPEKEEIIRNERVSRFETKRFDDSLDKVSSLLNEDPIENDDVFHELNTPIFIVIPRIIKPNRDTAIANELLSKLGVTVDSSLGEPSIVKSPILKEIEFYKVVDPYTAFQELSMYNGGVLGASKEPLQISDRDMRDAKGFDEWSFKKRPKRKK